LVYHIPGIVVNAKGTLLPWSEALKKSGDWALSFQSGLLAGLKFSDAYWRAQYRSMNKGTFVGLQFPTTPALPPRLAPS